MASSISHESPFDEQNDNYISSESVTSNALSETSMFQSSKPDGPVIDQIEANNETDEHESDFEDVEEDEQNGDENEEEEIIQKDTDVNGGAPSVLRLGSFKIANPKRAPREPGTSQSAKNYRIRKIQGVQKELWDEWGVQSIFFVRSPNESKASLFSKAVGTEAKQFLNHTDVGKNIKRQVDAISATWPARPKQDISEKEGKKNKTKNQNRATTEVTERLLTLAAKRAAEKEAMKRNQNKMPFTFTLPNTKKKLATNIRAKKAAENVAVVGLSTDEPENEMQIIEVSQSEYDQILQSIEMESPDSITPVINEAQEELSTKVVSTGNSASQGAATKTVPVKSILKKGLPVKPATVKTVSAQITTSKTGLPKPISTELIVTKPVATSSTIEIPSSRGLENMSESSVIDEALEELSTKVVSTGNSASQGAATKTVPVKSILKKGLPVKSATVKTVSAQITTSKTGLPKPISTELIVTKPVATSSTIEIPSSRGLENMSESSVIDEALEELSTKVVSTGNSASQGAATKTVPVKSILKKGLPVKSATVKTVSAQITTAKTGLPKPISTELIVTKPVATKIVATSNTIEIPRSRGLENISETSAPQELVANTVVTENFIPGVANISVPDKFLAAAMVEIPQGIGSELDTLPETSEIETSEQKSDKTDAAPENLAAKTVVTESVAPTNVAKNAAPVPFVRFVAAESIASVNVPPKSDEAISLAAKTDDPKDAVPKILSAKSIEPRTVATRSVATRTKSVNSIETETAEKKGAVKITKPRKEQEIAKESGHNEVCMAATCLESTTATAVNWVQCDECSKWFHYKCIGVKRVSRKKRFLCPVCKV